MDNSNLKKELKQHIINYLNLQDMSHDDLPDDELLFGEELGLDSIDSLELIVMLEREYGVKINNPREGRKVLTDVNTIADYIIKHGNKSTG